MSVIHVQQIKAALEAAFDGHIDLSDKHAASLDERQKAYLTRTLAAFIPFHYADAKPESAAISVIDGPDDNGIDSIYYDTKEKILYVIQSKWNFDGHGSIAKGEMLNFIAGFKDLVNLRTERFNQRFSRIAPDIRPAILDANTKFMLIVVCTGQEDLSQHARRDMNDLLYEMNDPSEVVAFRYLRQGDVHSLISENAKGAPINIDVILYDWGMTRTPFQAFYGQIAASEAAHWYAGYHPRIFAPNLRVFLGATDANAGIIRTATERPDYLWYFNNGVTAICDMIKKKPLGGDSRDSGIFECKNFTVVNGAQTIGAISTAYTKNPGAVEKGRIPIKIISLEGCPPRFCDRDYESCKHAESHRIERLCCSR